MHHSEKNLPGLPSKKGKWICKHFWCRMIIPLTINVLKHSRGSDTHSYDSTCSVLTLGKELAWRSHWGRTLQQGRQCSLPLCCSPAWCHRFLQGRGAVCLSTYLPNKRAKNHLNSYSSFEKRKQNNALGFSVAAKYLHELDVIAYLHICKHMCVHIYIHTHIYWSIHIHIRVYIYICEVYIHIWTYDVQSLQEGFGIVFIPDTWLGKCPELKLILWKRRERNWWYQHAQFKQYRFKVFTVQNSQLHAEMLWCK